MYNKIVPDFLTHYYESSSGPFQSLSTLPIEQAERVLEKIREEGIIFASQRSSDYLRLTGDIFFSFVAGTRLTCALRSVRSKPR